MKQNALSPELLYQNGQLAVKKKKKNAITPRLTQ